ncbi:hypothetical protein [Hoeflea prorocentri]|uniref:Uncharacterized protein n=1 Tax=Hoeflea prorocentri TaxID=1922333 RepID=A0A9X3UGX4_9HYPH|nr:hypothetical protein [Hoeflea prorocentri]MCY6381168.1 hypothetical protein [Hoeflea prorocentri]MDA5398968.1 hypothetical protein [Hoeflea prorocentri]
MTGIRDPKKILMVQPQLESLDGHEHTQIKAVQSLLPQSEIAIATRYGFGLSGQIDDLNIMPVLPRGAHFGAELKEAVLSTGLTQADLILVPSAGPDEIEALMAYYEEHADEDSPTAKLRILSADILSGCSDVFLDRLRNACQSGKIKLLTEAEELQAHFEDRYGLPIAGQLNLPCTILPDDPDIEAGKRGFEDVTTIGVLGRQRSEKGSYRIPSIMKHLGRLTDRHSEKLRIHFLYQAVGTKRLRRLSLELKTRFNRLANPNITIDFVGSGLSEQRFRRLVLDADILLLPYNVSRYQFSGSGMIMDGVFAGKPIVCSNGMAMRNVLSHGNCEQATSDEEFAEKLLMVATNKAKYDEGAAIAASFAADLLVASARNLRD